VLSTFPTEKNTLRKNFSAKLIKTQENCGFDFSRAAAATKLTVGLIP
jgi:hypothetical protein